MTPKRGTGGQEHEHRLGLEPSESGQVSDVDSDREYGFTRSDQCHGPSVEVLDYILRQCGANRFSGAPTQAREPAHEQVAGHDHPEPGREHVDLPDELLQAGLAQGRDSAHAGGLRAGAPVRERLLSLPDLHPTYGKWTAAAIREASGGRMLHW